MKSSKIVIIDDEADVLEMLKYNLELEKTFVYTFLSGKKALDHIRENPPDIIVCDWILDDIEGLELCRALKMDAALCDIPFVMLTGKGHEVDVVTALEMGAEDYIIKPIRIKELIVRLKKILKRHKTASQQKDASLKNFPDNSNIITYNEITIDIEKYQVFMNNTEVELTYSEFKLLQLFITRKGKVYSRNQIIEKLNGMDYMATERSVDVQIVGLRKKMGSLKNYLETVRGLGYRMRG